jgi:hypothetical protein
MSGKGISSVYGYDYFVPKQPSVISEYRLYPIIDYE